MFPSLPRLQKFHYSCFLFRPRLLFCLAFFVCLFFEYNHVTMLYYFWLYSEVNQLYLYICPLPLGLHSQSSPIPPLSVITEHRAELFLLYSSFPLAGYFTHDCVICQSYSHNSSHSLIPFHPISTSLFFTSALKNAYF